MTFAAECLDATQIDDWMKVLAECPAHDSYHLPGYHALAERCGEGAARLFVYRDPEGVIAFPFLLRKLESVPGLEEAGEGWCDANSVYGYPGPIASCGNPSETAVRRFQSALRETLSDMRVVSLFSRLHPLLPQRHLIAGLGETLPSGETVSIDLTLPLEEQVMRYRAAYRRDVKKMRGQALVCVEDCKKVHLARFVEIYRRTMERVSASGYYFFDDTYFQELIAKLGDAIRLFVVLDGVSVASAGLFIAHGDFMQYHLGGTADEYASQAPSKLLLDGVRIAATEDQRKVFHLGGGLGGQRDSLFFFKSGFSERTHEFSVWRWVLDVEKYDALAKARERWWEDKGMKPAGGNFFPLYRVTAAAGTGGDL